MVNLPPDESGGIGQTHDGDLCGTMSPVGWESGHYHLPQGQRPVHFSGRGKRNMLNRILAAMVALAASCVVTHATEPSADDAAARPNIVLIMADDLGWADLHSTGSTFYETPHLDRLALQGMRFPQAYAACPVCSPTRAAAMTGKYPARLHLTDYIPGARRGKLNPVRYRHQLPLDEVTIAEAFAEAGYATALIGKWHLGGAGYLPTDQGFASAVGMSPNADNMFFGPFRTADLPDGPPGEYLTDRLTDEVVKFIAAARDKPFLLWLTHYDVHIPLQAKPELIKQFEARAAALPTPTSQRFRREGTTLDRRIQDHAIYAAKVASLDESVGRVMEALAQGGIANNTIILFTSDNGGLSTAEGSPTSNAPLRAGKGWLYEGGLRVPLLIKWPRHIAEGCVCESPVITTDLYPTLLDLAGLAARPAQHCDGESLAPLLRKPGALTRTALYWHYPHYSNQGGSPSGAVRVGDWKLIEFFEDDRLELYDLAHDREEAHNLVARFPDRANALRAQLHDWRANVSAEMPLPNPDYQP